MPTLARLVVSTISLSIAPTAAVAQTTAAIDDATLERPHRSVRRATHGARSLRHAPGRAWCASARRTLVRLRQSRASRPVHAVDADVRRVDHEAAHDHRRVAPGRRESPVARRHGRAMAAGIRARDAYDRRTADEPFSRSAAPPSRRRGAGRAEDDDGHGAGGERACPALRARRAHLVQLGRVFALRGRARAGERQVVRRAAARPLVSR